MGQGWRIGAGAVGDVRAYRCGTATARTVLKAFNRARAARCVVCVACGALYVAGCAPCVAGWAVQGNLLKTVDKDEAVRSFQEAIALRPDSPVPDNNLGLLYARIHRASGIRHASVI